MTSRERIIGALEGKEIDRLPVTLFIVDEGHFLKQVRPDLDIFDYMENKKRCIDLHRELGVDVHLRMWNGCFPLWLQTGGINTDASTKDWQVDLKKRKTGESIITHAVVTTPDGTIEQEYTISQVAPGTYHYACTKKPIQSLRDMELVEAYEPSVPPDYKDYLGNLVTRTKEYLGEDGVVSLWIPGGVFNHASRLIDLDQLYMIFITEPDYYKALMEFCLKRTRPWLEAQLSTDLDIVNIGGNVGGGFLGKVTFDEYILPYEKRYINFVKSTGKYTQYHNCGEVMVLLDSYKTLGSDIIEPFSPPPLGDADLTEVVKRAENAFAIVGNIDQVNVLQKGSPDLAREKVKDVCELGKQYPRFVLQTADFLEYDTPLENVKAYVKAGKEYGRF